MSGPRSNAESFRAAASAIFYGALSVHAGAYLLLRAGPLLERAPGAALLVTVTGLVTALYATLCGRVQTDVKTALAYASLTQVGMRMSSWRTIGLMALALKRQGTVRA